VRYFEKFITSLLIILISNVTISNQVEYQQQAYNLDTTPQISLSSNQQNNLVIAELESSEKSPLSLSLGYTHSCVLTHLGEVDCFGQNNQGQSGVGNSNSVIISPQTVSNLGLGRTVLNLTTTLQGACVLLDNSDVKCWGEDYGRSATPVTGLPSNRVTSIFSGFHSRCIITNSSEAYCWGSNENAELGLGNTTSGRIAEPLGPLSFPTNRTPLEFIFGADHTCSLMDNFSVMCWGKGNYGQLGNGASGNLHSPSTFVKLPAGSTVVDIVSTWDSSCALLNSNEVYCWGSGVLGLGTTPSSSRSTTLNPLKVVNLSNSTFVKLVSGNHQVCTLTITGTSQCWGRELGGNLGRGVGSLLNQYNHYYDTPEELGIIPLVGQLLTWMLEGNTSVSY